MTKAIVAAPFIPISRFPHSHRGAQGVIYADMIRETGRDVTCNMSLELYHSDFNQFDELWVYHGNDWSDGGLNIFGGLQNFPYAFNFENFTRFKGKVYSLAIPFPDYHSMLQHKMNLARSKDKFIQPEWLRADMENLVRMQETAETVTHPNVTGRLVVGDSHAICMYRPGWTIESIPFKTLHGALNIGLENLIPACYDEGWNGVREAEFYFGNIDIRHHLCRQEDPRQAALELGERYVRQVADLADKYNVECRIYETLPCENESRPLPKTGYYEGKPFYGSWSERMDARRWFNDMVSACCIRDGVQFVRWTAPLVNDAGELDFRFMERPKSVHLSRAAYPHWQGVEWNGGATLEDFNGRRDAGS